MTRLDVFQEWVKKYRGKKLVEKLTGEELKEVLAFIQDNKLLGPLEFEYKVNRLYLDNPNKPRNLGTMCEILIAINN